MIRELGEICNKFEIIVPYLKLFSNTFIHIFIILRFDSISTKRSSIYHWNYLKQLSAIVIAHTTFSCTARAESFARLRTMPSELL